MQTERRQYAYTVCGEKAVGGFLNLAESFVDWSEFGGTPYRYDESDHCWRYDASAASEAS